MVKSGGAAALVSILSLFLGACASSPSISLTELPSTSGGGVQPGDQVSIALYTGAGVKETEVSGDRSVDPNGEIFLPLLGTVSVAGMETADIRRLLVRRYSALYSDPVVEVVTNVHVNVTGAVRQAGQFFVPPWATLVDVLAQAGGVTSEVDISLAGGASDPSRVRLVRNGVTSVLDVRPLSISEDVVSLQVQSGDWIYVPRAPGSQTRQRITFWGSLFSTLFTAASLIVLIVQN